MPRIECLDSLRRPHAAEQLLARQLMHVGGEQRGVEIGPEPGDEEHDLRGDEQDHPVAVGDLHDRRVMALIGRLARDVAPPADHGVERADHADAEHVGGGREHVMHPGDGADRHHEHRDRADRRPRARVDEVVVVMRLGVGVGHLGCLRLCFGMRACAVIPSRSAARRERAMSPLRPRRLRLAHRIHGVGERDGIETVLLGILHRSRDRRRTPPPCHASRRP